MADTLERTDIRPGQTIRVHQKIRESGKERVQVFEGVVLARKHGNGPSASFTIRKLSDGIAVERIFPINSPIITKLDLVRTGKTRRAKLYHLRDPKAKQLKEKK